ncbi:hypothetical protein MASR2M78_18150 [Treponema sp.]
MVWSGFQDGFDPIHRLYRSTSENGTYTKVWEGVGTEYTDTGLTAGTDYWYFVTASDSHGESPKSAKVKATTLANSQGGIIVGLE